jgi:diguanylate cyclase (GGDEF)-like protein/PAS domain S-box-containing protein
MKYISIFMSRLFFQKFTDLLRQSISLRAVLGWGFGQVLSLVGIIGILAIVEQQASTRQFSELLDRDLRAAETGQKIVVAMASARRFEKDFLIFHKEFGFAEAKSRYITLLQANLAHARENLSKLDLLIGDSGTKRRISAVLVAITRYENAVLSAVDLQGQLGYIDTGIEGRFRLLAHEMEAMLGSKSPSQMVSLLSVRRGEKDYLLRGREIDVQSVRARVAQFKREVTFGVEMGVKRRKLLSLADAYQSQFDRYVQVDREIEIQRRAYRSAVQAIEPDLQQLLASTQEKSRRTSDGILRSASYTQLIIAGAALASIGFGVLVAWLATRRITTGIESISAFAQRLENGDFRVSVPWVGKDEFSVLGRHLCHLAHALQAATNSQQERTTELEAYNVSLQYEVAQRTAAEMALHKANIELEQRVLARTEELVESEKRFRQLADLSSDWYWQQDVDFRFTEVSSGITRKSGVSADEYIGKTRWEMPIVMTPDQWASHKAILAAHAPFFDLEFSTSFEHISVRWFSISGEPIFDESGVFSGYRGVGKDITERKEIEQHIKHLSLHDGLTGLPSRALLNDRLTQALTYADRYGHAVWVGFIDLDAFKPINDTFGHSAGDIVLQVVAKRLQNSIRDSDTVARLGGDEFVIVLAENLEHDEPREIWARLMQSVAMPISIDGRDVILGCSVGVAAYPADGATAAGLIQAADAAMYRAKREGSNNLRYYSDDQREKLLS